MKKVFTDPNTAIIKNVVGTGDRECSCGPWLDHWEKHSRKVSGLCSVDECSAIAIHGAHVQRILDDGNHHFIIPMCASHNGDHGGMLIAKAGTTYVWANKKEMCGE